MAKPKPATAIVVDLERCLACKSCELACTKAHAGFEDIVEAILSEAHLVPRVKVIAAGGRAVAVSCQHCEEPACVAACPSDAMRKDEASGLTRAVPENCTGCKLCMRACPYDAVIWDKEARSVVICDLCEGIIEEGEEPACVLACPTGARIVGRLDEYQSFVKANRIPTEELTFSIDPELCVCCGRCAKGCPAKCITGKAGKAPAEATEEQKKKGKVGVPFKIDQDACLGCGMCHEVCRAGAVLREQRRESASPIAR